jgi:hypothetical protein
MEVRFSDAEIKKDLGFDNDRSVSAPVFDSITGALRNMYEIPLEDIKFIFQYTYDSEVQYFDNTNKCSLSLFSTMKGGYWGFLRHEVRQVELTSEPIAHDTMKIYATRDFRAFFNKYIGSDEREFIWTIMKLAGKTLRGEQVDPAEYVDGGK